MFCVIGFLIRGGVRRHILVVFKISAPERKQEVQGLLSAAVAVSRLFCFPLLVSLFFSLPDVFFCFHGDFKLYELQFFAVTPVCRRGLTVQLLFVTV